MNSILFVLWFFAPAGIANAAPVFASRIPLLSRYDGPLDRGKTFHGKRIFGDHKTIRGLLSGMLLSTLVVLLQILLYREIFWFRELSGAVFYGDAKILLLGPLFGMGALGGDAIKSFFKRQIGIASGGTWFPFDQLDYIAGGIVASLPIVTLKLTDYALLVVVWFLVHPLSTVIAWLTGLKDSPL